MKIGIVLYPTFGGSGVVATELGKALALKGHQIHFITYSQPVRLGSFRENIYYHEVAISDYPLFEYQPYETELASKMVDVVKYENLDLLHVHYAIPHASAAFMAQQILRTQGIDIPFITTLHGTDITLVGKDPSFEPVITFCINASNAVTAVSESLRKDTYAHFATDREIHVIPNFIQAKLTLQAIDLEKRRHYAMDHERILCHISNFRKVKRVEDVVEIFRQVQERIPAKLILGGDGPERPLVERMAREMGICNKIIFTGKVRETGPILEIADLFLLPSETESFGLAALEAMAEGVPVVSSNTGGIPEVNHHGFSGYLSNVGDVNEMSKHAIHILSDDARLHTFREQSLAQAHKFSLKEVLPIYENLYAQVIKELQVV
ncbi:MAG: N-acetyl-alpha-D-glucosaminyl L-malate synthase BshA [Candidatus Fluviicola riflensis]|nr:MAG: N-acetyl-alpha-D-glucosaminyl L-malate synthase BshA [Candidatus Fluviicola riflensis]OGS79654.1 MAG: N-acetyl-alpha-D-glucosaminyl L-malate synthase BshA [Candidatus Fluviicola riflensis]OGS87086.1 MAG: N-acetyl-alpha-D-glucosaminyl L-malate synthase BshA [Fluviicola sp. RIFCSPHIGHO2_01_FULL_43_53]OGS89876.1 MAG: N-acetyl-alpha-D-glucosaminyl L-malate synthase BshA [Fluviicola sp. RIFCSPHIGHO2_12_FULL_43_24]